MFQPGSKLYLNPSNWKRYHEINYSNINTDRYKDNDNPAQKPSKIPCYLKRFNRFKARNKTSQTTGIRRGNNPPYSISSVKERFTNDAGSYTGIDIFKVRKGMTNTLSVMANVLRNVVSKQRKRYKENGFNLDLAYITPNIIAMGYPAESYESIYRNSLSDVYKFLEAEHRDHYKIYNLCLERSYDISKFHGRVAVYPFEDHNPPTIELILQFCQDVDSWLKEDNLNVAAIHCKAGKGRTGTMICCFLVYSAIEPTAEDALALYDDKRTNDRKGVTIPSQKRYVQYFAKLIGSGLKYERRTLQICEIRFKKNNTLTNHGTVKCSIFTLHDRVVHPVQAFHIDFRRTTTLDLNTVSLSVTGDIKVELTKNNKKIMHLWFNTYFITDYSVVEGDGTETRFVYTLTKYEIDDVHKDKSFADDFKVEIVFTNNQNSTDRDTELPSCSSRSTSQQRSPAHNPGELPLQQQPSNYSLPNTVSSNSDVNATPDPQASTSPSTSSSFGASRSGASNGFEPCMELAQRNICAVHDLNNHHGINHVNDSAIHVFSTPSTAQHGKLPPSYTESQQHPQSQEKNWEQPGTTILANTDIVGNGGEDQHTARNPMSTNLNANESKNSINSSNNCARVISNSYNHNHSNSSSNTNSVSSQSSSSQVGDNEEDWESGESQAKQLENITLLLSSSSLTNPTLNLFPPITPTSSTPQPSILPNTTLTCFPNSLRTNKNSSSVNSNFSNIPSLSSNPNPTSFSFPTLKSSSSYTSSKTSNSSCTNRIVGVDDVDDDEKKYENETKNMQSNSKNVVKPIPYTAITNTKSLEFKDEDNKNNITSSITHEANQAATVPTSPANRPKLLHLLMAPKSVQQQRKSHKNFFKQKPSKKILKVSGSKSSLCSAFKIPDDATIITSAGNSGGVATTSKLKLKIKVKKNKFKFSKKFQWFQNYFRSDPVDFCENFVQQTTSLRHNSMNSMSSRTRKLSTTTPQTVSASPPVIHIDTSCEKLNHATSFHSVSTSNASIATGDMCEDYYSSICDNQLSFSNSPCKSPRTMADMARSISAGGVNHNVGPGSCGNGFAKNTASSNLYIRERRETLPGCTSHINGVRRNNGNVVVVAAKPAKTHAIGFNVNATILASQDSFEITEDNENVEKSPASVYDTQSSASETTGEANEKTSKHFVYPQTPHSIEAFSDNIDVVKREDIVSIDLPAKPLAKYSLNLVIVKECSEPPISAVSAKNPSSIFATDNIESDCDSSHKRMFSVDKDAASPVVDSDVEKEKIQTAGTASVCSNSSSSGFCTSECCTNSSSSSCNCNPFALDLERVAASCIKQELQQNVIHEVVESSANVIGNAANENTTFHFKELSSHSDTKEPTI